MTNRNTEVLKPLPLSGAHLEELLSLAVSGLMPMFHPDSQLFCYRRKLSGAALVNEGLSPRYTMMSLLGLARRESSGHAVPFDLRKLLRGLLSAKDRMRNLGDLGLLLWLCGEVAPESVPDACDGLDLRDVLKHSQQARQGRTMELAWLLAGLAHVRSSAYGDMPLMTDVAFEAYRLLGKNQGPHGIFGHSDRGRSLQGIVRGHIGSFADQVYPIYALAKFGQAYGVGPAVEMARRCGEAICRMQGPSGQWWWHYDARTGKVFETYPVYSVHQHGMAPMALFALVEATGSDFTDAIYQGLGWVSKNNELRTDLRDGRRQLIWRGIHLGLRGTLAARALSFMGKESRPVRVDNLRVRFECRPYELGWLLYALSGRNVEAAKL